MLHFFIHLPPIGHIKLETPDEWRCAAVARQVRQGSRRVRGESISLYAGTCIFEDNLWLDIG